MRQVKVEPKKKNGRAKIVFVKAEPDKMGVYCTFYGDNSEDFQPLGNKYVRLPIGYSREMQRRAEESAARDYFA